MSYGIVHDQYEHGHMMQRAVFDKIELYLVRVFHTVISERSVSRAALRLSSSQPAVSAQLRRLRALLGDPLLVRSGNGMAPTAVALKLLEPASALLASADALFGGKVARSFEPGSSTLEFRIAASDYLDPLFLPALITRMRPRGPRRRGSPSRRCRPSSTTAAAWPRARSTS